jgi:hypothetical protein
MQGRVEVKLSVSNMVPTPQKNGHGPSEMQIQFSTSVDAE